MKSLINRKNNFSPLSKSRNPLFYLQQEIDRLFNQFFEGISSERFMRKETQNLTIRPMFDVVEDDKNYKIEIEMPGLDESDIHVSVKNDLLNVKAEKEVSHKNEGKEYARREIEYGNYEFKFSLPDYIDTNKAKATFKKGMLWVNFPKKEGVKETAKELKVEKAK